MGKGLIITVFVGLLLFSFAGCRPEDEKKAAEAEPPAETEAGQRDEGSADSDAASEGTEETSDPGFPGDRGGDSGNQTSIVSQGSVASGGNGG